MLPNPQTALPLPPRPSLERYKKLAKELVKACRSSNEKAIGDKLLKTLAPAFETNAGDWVSVQWNGQRKKFREWVEKGATSPE